MRQEELRKQAEKLAEERRIAREKAQEWTREVKRLESDEEREKAAKKAKRGKRSEHVSGDEGVEGEPKQKKRRGKLKKSSDSGAENDGEALFSGDDEEQKPRKVRWLLLLDIRGNLTVGFAAYEEAGCSG